MRIVLAATTYHLKADHRLWKWQAWPPPLLHATNMQIIMCADIIHYRNEYFNGTDLAIGDLQTSQTRSDGHD